MRILMENSAPEQVTRSNVVNVSEQVNEIIDVLTDAKHYIGDDEGQQKRLETARLLLGCLLDDLQDENNAIVYFSGTPEEFMSEGADRKKTEEIHCVCDTMEELKRMIALFQRFDMQPDNILIPLIECRKKLRKYADKLNCKS